MKLKKSDCQILINKMIKRINTWSSRNLLFAVRSQLVNSVLISMHIYWRKIFLLPKSVLKEVNGICRCFLWTNTFNDNKPEAIAWDHLCKSESIGGLGFRDALAWNIITIYKLVLSIA